MQASDVSGLMRAYLLLISMAMTAPAITAEQKQSEAASPPKPPKVQPTPPKTRPPDRSSTFTPSEKIRADSSVSFPVDI